MNTVINQWFAWQAADASHDDIHNWLAGVYGDISHYWQEIVWC